MICKYDNQNQDQLDAMAHLWLDTIILAHHFIPRQYWVDLYPSVKKMLSAANLYLFLDQDQVHGFVSLSDASYIAGLFVHRAHQHSGVGTALVRHLQSNYPRLTLHVYRENTPAIAFYKKMDFYITSQSIDTQSGHEQYHMEWVKP